jgi:hypothetical protein
MATDRKGFTQNMIDKLPGPPADGKKASINHIDPGFRGFGVCVTRTGYRSYFLRYTVNDRERIITIGSTKDWKLESARDEAHRLRVEISKGNDPQRERQKAREALTVHDLLDRWKGNDGSDGNRRKRCPPSRDWQDLRDSTKKNYERFVKAIRRKFGSRKAAELEQTEIEEWISWICAHGFGKDARPGWRYYSTANQALNRLWHIYTMAVKAKLLSDNPCIDIKHYPEPERIRYLDPNPEGEKERLLEAAQTMIGDPRSTWHT